MLQQSSNQFKLANTIWFVPIVAKSAVVATAANIKSKIAIDFTISLHTAAKDIEEFILGPNGNCLDAAVTNVVLKANSVFELGAANDQVIISRRCLDQIWAFRLVKQLHNYFALIVDAGVDLTKTATTDIISSNLN